MNKIVFSTYCEDYLQDRFGVHKLVSSFKYFHSNIDIILYGSEEMQRICREYNAKQQNLIPCILLDVKKRYNTDFVCHIDADSICCGRFDEIFKFDYEVASAKNNCDLHLGDERPNRPQQLWDLPNNKYVSCGCVCTNSEKFLWEWKWLNDEITKQYGGIKAFWMVDQNWMNVLFHYGGYSSKILDRTECDVFYGASANTYKDCKWEYVFLSDDPEHIIKEWGKNNWQSWKQIEYKDGIFWLFGKKVKLLHQAGGGNPKTANKLTLDMFNDRIALEFKKIFKQ